MLSRMAKGFPTIQAKATEEMVQPVHDMQGKRWRQTDSLSLESDTTPWCHFWPGETLITDPVRVEAKGVKNMMTT